jgi:hypothetical protein
VKQNRFVPESTLAQQGEGIISAKENGGENNE